jgi:hypothetical protein
MKKILSLAIIVTLLTPATPLYAASNVHVDDLVLSQCGDQAVALSGTVPLAAGERLAVQLDGENVSYILNGSLWVTGFKTVTVGDHHIIAAVVDGSVADPLDFSLNIVAIQPGVIDTDHETFEVETCPIPLPVPTPTPSVSAEPIPTPSPTPTPANPPEASQDSSNGGGDNNNEQPEPTPIVKKGQVKGASIKKVIAGAIPNKLVPAVVARIFKQVFGRAIQPFESTYWKVRARTDKTTESLLKSTMEWYKAHGKTVGK